MPGETAGVQPSPSERAATLAAWRLDAGTRPLGAVLDLGDGQCHSAGLAVPQWNGLLLRRAPADPSLYAEAAAWFDGRGMPYGVVVPAEVGAAPPGGVPLPDLPVMVRDLAALPPLPDLDYDDGPGADEVARVQAEAFGDPYEVDLAFVTPVLGAPWRRTVVVRERGRAVATACAVLTGPAAVVFDVAVLPPERGRGLGRAATLWALHRAADGGATSVSLNPSTAGYHLYAGLGFTDAAPWRVWQPA